MDILGGHWDIRGEGEWRMVEAVVSYREIVYMRYNDLCEIFEGRRKESRLRRKGERENVF
jgi:hypothetical protein